MIILGRMSSEYLRVGCSMKDATLPPLITETRIGTDLWGGEGVADIATP